MKKLIYFALISFVFFVGNSLVRAESVCDASSCQANQNACFACNTDKCYWFNDYGLCYDMDEARAFGPDINEFFLMKSRLHRSTTPVRVSRVSCGNITGIPAKIPEITSTIVLIVEIAIPVVLVIVGAIDLIKGVTSQKEDEIKKGQQALIKRLFTAALVFFLVVGVKFIISLVADRTSSNNISDCISCFVNGNCVRM